jgi:hypothetical protein
MTNNPSQPNIAKIRQLLLAAFTPEDLRRLCDDRFTFQPVVHLFGPGPGAVDRDGQKGEGASWIRSR